MRVRRVRRDSSCQGVTQDLGSRPLSCRDVLGGSGWWVLETRNRNARNLNRRRRNHNQSNRTMNKMTRTTTLLQHEAVGARGVVFVVPGEPPEPFQPPKGSGYTTSTRMTCQGLNSYEPHIIFFFFTAETNLLHAHEASIRASVVPSFPAGALTCVLAFASSSSSSDGTLIKILS
mmetsp:Transcript_6988/g.16973  ORF Transcript_6988/g.16973 Transcript_6988/m.16973 type:complete len:175 (-) Transcript_6988:251-775(-)